ncbi:hypothetical protein ANN_14759 [Periplaneta americana]|uniref:Uncharacterized protein n=1 Tax=Periplaneta americana TaxID=6978 RepID=A0ABQ8SX66_PERAM|nr:hypothetical protein ANN_14759 [Periplaneta americana]
MNRILDAARRIKNSHEQLSRSTSAIHTRAQQCIEAEGGIRIRFRNYLKFLPCDYRIPSPRSHIRCITYEAEKLPSKYGVHSEDFKSPRIPKVEGKPRKNLNQVTCPDRDSNSGHLVSRPDALTVTPQVSVIYKIRNREISFNVLFKYQRLFHYNLVMVVRTFPIHVRVNPAEPRVDINDGKWEAKDATLPRQQSVCSPTPEDHDASVDSIAVSEEPPPDLPGNPCTRKSSKAKRVKNYLKKCKDAALGNSNAAQNDDKEQSAEPAADQEGPEPARLRTSRRRSNSGSREVSTTSWYVASTLEPSTNLVSVVEVLPRSQLVSK